MKDLLSPEAIAQRIRDELGSVVEGILVVGDINDRTVLIDLTIEGAKSQVCLSLKGAIRDTGLFRKYGGDSLGVSDPDSTLSASNVNPEAMEMLRKPEILMVALYHPENFPLPRFPLGISDIAGAIRRNFVGQISLSDMQLDLNISDIIEQIKNQRPDILGISVTFGQQDKLEELLNTVANIEGKKPLIVIGGSLAALNAEYLLQKYPNVIIGNGYGETTMQDMAEFWHGKRRLEEVNDITYLENRSVNRTPKRRDDKAHESVPELDLLPKILAGRGVMQMETSRGCTYACSFCPRNHKGLWADQAGDGFKNVLGHIEKVFDKFPDTARTIFLVDEEFVGYRGQDLSLERGKAVATTIKNHGFNFESSTRIDQVYRPSKSREWHEERFKFWRHLANNGLNRMLFGMESGVASILKRFNKKTTPEQNVMAIRALSTCGVPMRITCITFDPLMTMDELKENYQFQARTDILLRQNDSLSDGEVYDAIGSQEYIEANKLDKPLYSEIPYMLVSMECLLGSSYLKMVEDEGLAGDVSLSMGRRSAEYRDPRIGLMSQFSQLWIDRNFALDYLLKSITKVSKKDVGETVRELRGLIKEFAYTLLGKMITLADQGESSLTAESLSQLLDQHFHELVSRLETSFQEIRDKIPMKDRPRIEEEIALWKSQSEWKLINN